MTYCQSCGLLIETVDCPICGHNNYSGPQPSQGGPAVSGPVATEEYAYTGRSVHFVVGGVGACLLGLAATILAIIPLYNLMEGNLWSFESHNIYIIYISSTMLFLAGCGLQMFGLYGLYRHYGSYVGLVTLLYSAVAPIILLVMTLLAIETSSYHYYQYSHLDYDIKATLWIGHLFIGILLILMGVSWRQAKYKFGWEEPNRPVGTLFIISGIMFITFLGFVGIPWVIMSVAGFSAGTLFFIARPQGKGMAQACASSQG